MEWTKEADEKLKLLDKYGVSVADMAKIIGTSYGYVHARLNRIRNVEDNQESFDNNEEKLALQKTRETICVLYIAHVERGDKVADVAKACGFKRTQVERCLAECHADGTYRKVLKRITDYQTKVGQI